MVAHILPAALITNVHLMAAPCAPGDAVQQKFSVARGSSGLDAHVFGSVVSYDTPDFFISRPVDIGGISVLHDKAPFLHWPWGFHRRSAFAPGRTDARSSIDEGACI